MTNSTLTESQLDLRQQVLLILFSHKLCCSINLSPIIYLIISLCFNSNWSSGNNKRNHKSPKDPAVMPILTKNPNSSKSFASGGMDIKILVKNVLANIEIKVCCYG